MYLQRFFPFNCSPNYQDVFLNISHSKTQVYEKEINENQTFDKSSFYFRKYIPSYIAQVNTDFVHSFSFSFSINIYLSQQDPETSEIIFKKINICIYRATIFSLKSLQSSVFGNGNISDYRKVIFCIDNIPLNTPSGVQENNLQSNAFIFLQ